MRMLLTSHGLHNHTLVSTVADLLGRPFAEANAIMVLDAIVAIPGDKNWLFDKDIDPFRRLGWQEFDFIALGSVPHQVAEARLRHADVVYAEGGDQHNLMNVIVQHDFVGLFWELLDTKVYVGESAGSMIFSRHYNERSAKLFEGGDPQPATAPFPLFDWYAKPHFNSPFFPERTVAWADRLAGVADFPTYLLDDDSAVRVQGEIANLVTDVVSEGEWRLVPGRTV